MFFYTFIIFCALTCYEAKNIQPIDDANPKYLFFLSENKLWRTELDTEAKLVNDNFVIDYELDDNENRLFWIDRAGQLFVRRIDDEKSPDKFAFQYHSATSAAKIALDTLTDKFYIIDGVSQEVDVIDAKGKNQTILFERNPVLEEHVIREKPRRIALEPRSGFMFILTDLNGVKNLYRSNMDGSSKKLLITNVGSDELSIDREHRRIFWANTEQKVIESADYDGQNKAFVMKIQGKVSVAVYNNQLFWITHDGGPSSKNIIHYCKLHENSCEEKTIRQTKLEKPTHKIDSLKIARTPHNHIKQTNPCEPNNAGCQHLCLLTSSTEKKFTCVCNTGWEFSNDEKKTCRPIVDDERRTRSKRQDYDLYHQQPTLRPEPQQPEQPSHIPIYIFYPGK